MASENQDGLKKSVICMQSELFSHEGELVWSISKLSQIKKSIIGSNEFAVVPNCKIGWELFLLLDNEFGTPVVQIIRKDEVAKTVSATIQCSFENSKGEAFMNYYSEGECGNSVPFKLTTLPEMSSIGCSFNECFHDDLLIVRCQIKLNNCCVLTKTIEKGEYKTSLSRSHLPMDLIRGFQKLYTERQWTDVEFKVGQMSFPAHKVILSIRSPVLKNMLESDMIEGRSGVIVIEDAQPKIFEAFLSFLYTDTIGEFSIEEIRELYAVADKYEVGSLQDKCSSELLENLSLKTVCKTLKLADLHNDDILKDAASKYIHVNFPALKHTPEFKGLRDNDPGLVLDIIMADHTLQSPLLNNSAAQPFGPFSSNDDNRFTGGILRRNQGYNQGTNSIFNQEENDPFFACQSPNILW